MKLQTVKSDLIFSVKEIFSDFLDHRCLKYFNIPAYQRGYKWTDNNVCCLLDDINRFKTDASSDRFYCLQHITLYKPDSGSSINVVDGQQRLTTLYIILSFLNQTCLIDGRLQYSVRRQTQDFISSHISTRKLWDSDQYRPKHKDENYMVCVAMAVRDWFMSHGDVDVAKFTDKLMNNVKLIVNLPEDIVEEQLFQKINGMKVNLDGADLVRAIVMTRGASERYVDLPGADMVNEYRVKMGMEIDEMNSWWSNRNVVQFYSRLLPDNALSSRHETVKFDYRLLPISLLYICVHCLYSSGGRGEPMFTFFEYGLDLDGNPANDNIHLYSTVRQVHLTLTDWYLNADTYHWLGYLFSNFKGREFKYGDQVVSVRFKDIYTLWCSEGMTRSRFVSVLQQAAVQLMGANTAEGRVQLTSRIRDIKENWFESELIVPILTLMDILMLKRQKKRLDDCNFFRSYNEDQEHIWCQNPRDESFSLETISKWATHITDAEDKAKLNEIISKPCELSDSDRSLVKEILTRHGAYSIGNLVLLNSSLNRSIGNKPYLQKRQDVFASHCGSHHKYNTFIRPWTLKIYLKGNATGDMSANDWSLADIGINADAIAAFTEQWICSLDHKDHKG